MKQPLQSDLCKKVLLNFKYRKKNLLFQQNPWQIPVNEFVFSKLVAKAFISVHWHRDCSGVIILT